MKISVTEEDIKNGVRMSASRCAVALAVKRTLGSPCVFIGPYNIYTYRGENDDQAECYAKTPVHVKHWIDAFDAGVESVQPFEFDLELSPFHS